MPPDQSNLPEGVERLSPNWHKGFMEADPEGVLLKLADRPKIIEQARQEEREKVLAWLAGDEAIDAAVKRQRLTNDAVGIAGLPRPPLDNAMGAVLVAVVAAARASLHPDTPERGSNG